MRPVEKLNLHLNTKKSRKFIAKGQWYELDGVKKYYRSQLELKYAKYLSYQKKIGQILSYAHEPETFWFLEIKRGIRCYKPDFKVIELNGDHYWVEVKGYMDSKSLTKIKRFRKYYPSERLIVVNDTWSFFKH